MNSDYKIEDLTLADLNKFSVSLAKRVLAKEYAVDHVLYLERAGLFVGDVIAKYFDFISNERNLPETILFLWAISTLLIFFSQRAFWMYHYIPLIPLFSVLSSRLHLPGGCVRTVRSHPAKRPREAHYP